MEGSVGLVDMVDDGERGGGGRGGCGVVIPDPGIDGGNGTAKGKIGRGGGTQGGGDDGWE